MKCLLSRNCSSWHCRLECYLSVRQDLPGSLENLAKTVCICPGVFGIHSRAGFLANAAFNLLLPCCSIEHHFIVENSTVTLKV